MKKTSAPGLVALMLVLLATGPALAHCDGLDGPVVNAARRALETGNVNQVMIWVQANQEKAIREAFGQALTVRRLSPAAREMADMYFFETLVHLHRAGEGAPYTGLKPAGRDLGPAIPAADQALKTGDVAPVLQFLTADVQSGIRRHFEEVMQRSGYAPDDVAAGRAYVAAYVEYVHYIEGLHRASLAGGHGHAGDEAEGSARPEHGHDE